MDKSSKKILGLAFAGLGALLASNLVSAASTLKFGGEVAVDFSKFTSSDYKRADADLRRAELFAKGVLSGPWSYQVRLTAEASDYRLVDDKDIELDTAWVGYALDPVWFAFGRVNAPFGLDNWTSSSYRTFMEKAAPANLAPHDIHGLYLGGNYDMVSFAASLGLPKDYMGNKLSNLWSYSGRVTVAPIMSRDTVLQVGASYFHEPLYNSANYGALNTTLGIPVSEVYSRANLSNPIPSVGGSANPTVGGGFASNRKNRHVWGLEAAGQYGPFTGQAEYFSADYEGITGAPDYDELDGYYGELSYVITGEQRSYDKQTATFGGVTPKSKMGAFEVGVRYSVVDAGTSTALTATTLGAAGVFGAAKSENITFGVNWYASKNLLARAQYVSAEIENNDTSVGSLKRDLDSFGLRVQYLF